MSKSRETFCISPIFNSSHNWLMFRSSYLRFLYHTQRHPTVGRTVLDEVSACRRNLYLTTHNTHNRQIRTHDLSRRADADLRLRPRVYWDRRQWSYGACCKGRPRVSKYYVCPLNVGVQVINVGSFSIFLLYPRQFFYDRIYRSQ